MLSVTDLIIQREEERVCGPLSFSVSKGEILHIKGPNGSGKTTLLKTLLGLNSDHQGEIQYHETLLSHNIGYIGHKLALTPALTVAENLSYLCFGEKPVIEIDDVLDRVGLSLEADSLIVNLSEGQKKRAALARFFCLRKAMWLLDEPFTALDVVQQSRFHDALSDYLTEGGMVILSSHQPFVLENKPVKEVEIS